jgi:2-polyprenyl-3-methyl-5-hydroxy-6-metoxy-1,4-benzoquinol methylase
MDTKKVKIVGLDVSYKAIEEFKSNTGSPAYQRDFNGNGLGLNDNEIYDYILLVEILEHVIFPHKILIEAVEHAKWGVIVTIPNTGYYKWRLQFLLGYFPRQSFTHLHYWTIKDFELFCKQLGLKVLDFKTFSSQRRYKEKIILAFKNLLAYQQCWLIEGSTTSLTRDSYGA